jgi:hypothetical protein
MELMEIIRMHCSTDMPDFLVDFNWALGEIFRTIVNFELLIA